MKRFTDFTTHRVISVASYLILILIFAILIYIMSDAIRIQSDMKRMNDAYRNNVEKIQRGEIKFGAEYTQIIVTNYLILQPGAYVIVDSTGASITMTAPITITRSNKPDGQ